MLTALLTALASVALAANALLARHAISEDLLDPASFASLRAVSAAVVLAYLVKRRANTTPTGTRQTRDFVAAAALAVFLLLFSYAYVTLDVGSGALILFAAAQLATCAGTFARGRKRPDLTASIGFVLVAAGLIYFLTGGDSAPPLTAAVAMSAAGIGAGVHSLRIGGHGHALEATSRNMTLAVVPVLAVHVIVASTALVTLPGVLIAVGAGAITTAGGLAAWFAVLPRLKALPTAMGRVAVPLVALLGGMALLGETATTSLLVAALIVLGGALVAAAGRARQVRDF